MANRSNTRLAARLERCAIRGGVAQDEVTEPSRLLVRIDRLLAEYPNLHADLSAGSGLNAFRRDLAYAREFVLRHSGKLMFGTDRFVREEDPEMIAVLRDMALPADMEYAVFRGNAERMLKLTVTQGGRP